MGTTFKVVMFSTSNIQSYASLAADINRRYCERQGYGFVHEQYDTPALAPPYEKVRVLQQHLGTSDYLFWLDSDACVVNFSQRLEEFCQTGKDFIIAGHKYGFDMSGRRTQYLINDIPCGLNSGVMLIRSCDWSRQFLDDWWRRCEIGAVQRAAYFDQGPLQQMLVENAVDLHSHIQLVTPCSRFNRCDDDHTDVCEFVLHLWGLGSGTRERILSQIQAGVKPDTTVSLPTFHVPAP